jgi:hypothetical protein
MPGGSVVHQISAAVIAEPPARSPDLTLETSNWKRSRNSLRFSQSLSGRASRPAGPRPFPGAQAKLASFGIFDARPTLPGPRPTRPGGNWLCLHSCSPARPRKHPNHVHQPPACHCEARRAARPHSGPSDRAAPKATKQSQPWELIVLSADHDRPLRIYHLLPTVQCSLFTCSRGIDSCIAIIHGVPSAVK